jgi:hypothetical protein
MGDVYALVSAVISFGQLSGNNSLLCPDLQGIFEVSTVFAPRGTRQHAETI